MGCPFLIQIYMQLFGLHKNWSVWMKQPFIHAIITHWRCVPPALKLVWVQVGFTNPKQNWLNRFHSGIVQVTKQIPFWNFPSHDYDLWNQELSHLNILIIRLECVFLSCSWRIKLFLIYFLFFLTFQNLTMIFFSPYFLNLLQFSIFFFLFLFDLSQEF